MNRMNRQEKLLAVANFIERQMCNHAVDLDEVLHRLPEREVRCLGMTRRGLVQFIRLNAGALGGEYRPGRIIPGRRLGLPGHRRQPALFYYA